MRMWPPPPFVTGDLTGACRTPRPVFIAVGNSRLAGAVRVTRTLTYVYASVEGVARALTTYPP